MKPLSKPMPASDTANIPSRDANLLRRKCVLSRRDLSAAVERVIHRGAGYQSSVYLVRVNGNCLAVKDFSSAPRAFRRWIAPFLVRRETAVLERLQGVAGVPRFYGRIDRLAFAMEFIEGTPLDTFGPGELPTPVFARVQEVIDAIHARGVSHGDLKRRSNLLLSNDGEIYLIDFAAAVIDARPNHLFTNWFTRWLQREMARVDNKSVPRLKKFVAPELLTSDDRDKLSNPTKLERWARKLLNR